MSVSASLYNYWGFGPSYGAYGYNYPSYGYNNYRGCAGYYGHYDWCRRGSYGGYGRDDQMMRYGERTLDNTYDFVSENRNTYRYGLETNSRDYNPWYDYEFQGHDYPNRDYFWN